MNRRTVLQLLTTAGVVQAGAVLGAAPQVKSNPLLLRPQDFGAKVDGIALDSPPINSAIDRANAQGGGVVYLSPGVYLCGTVVLKSNVTLYLEAGAVILGSKDVKQYTPQPGPPENADASTRHLIFARDADNITLCGAGLVDGQGPSFWTPSGRRTYGPDEQWGDVASLYLNPKPRVSPMLEFVNCRYLRVEQVRIENASGWTMRLMSCIGVVVDGVSIKNPVVGPNTDGIDISNSSDVRIANCSIDTGDDAICLKSENPYGESVPVMRNVTVTNCTLTSCCNGFKFGTRTYSGCENIVFSNSTIHNPSDSQLNARVIAGIGLEMVDGGWLENVVITGICMQRTRTPIFLRLGARTAPRFGNQSYMRGVMISDIYATEAALTSSVTGLSGMPVEDVTLSNIDIETREPGKRDWTEPLEREDDGIIRVGTNRVELVRYTENHRSRHGAFEVHGDALPTCSRRITEAAPVCGDELVFLIVEIVPGQLHVRVRNHHSFESRVIEPRQVRAIDLARVKAPVAIDWQHKSRLGGMVC